MSDTQEMLTASEDNPTYSMAKFVEAACISPGFSAQRNGRGWAIVGAANKRKSLVVPEVATGGEYIDVCRRLYRLGWNPVPRPWSGEPSLSIEEVTPAEACQLILRIPWYQRKLDDRKIAEWAGAMMRGEWRFTHQGLATDREGMLYDGQHRVAAQVVAGITLRHSIARGIEGETFPVVDRGKMRNSSYTFGAAGEKSAFNLSAVLRLMWLWENVPVGSWKDRHPVSDDQLKEVLDRHPGLRHSVKRGRVSARGAARATTLIHYLATQACGSSEIPDQWYAQLSSGENFQRRDPGLVLRNYLLGGEADGIRGRVPNRSIQTVVQMLFLFATAWNNTCTGQQRSIVKAYGDHGVPALKVPSSKHLFRFSVEGLHSL
ncbi:hypothetical protein OG760_18885 [Streptomyces sp. NBC_00963]|uniref:hypothetical protein n=1 Tax=Streptomyces sp. NBC_00963 TaxID=2903697 RepID=UPI00386DB172|nr:hypothetical protein OG760_18885 [Streptomyces sp. NBC_00963]